MPDKPKGYPATPENDKKALVHEQSQTIGEFLDWLMHDQDVHLMKWESVRHERVCTAYKPSRVAKEEKQELLNSLARIEAQLRGANPDEVVTPDIPEDAHPKDCVCNGTGTYVWYEEGWGRARTGNQINGWLAEYYEIDLNAMEEEQRAVLAWLRKENARKERAAARKKEKV